MPDFRIRVVVDPSAAQAGSKRVNRALDSTAARADKLRATLAKTFALIGGVAAITGGIRLLANYAQEMSTVQAITQATNEEFAQLTETAQKLGITTRFAATQAAEGMTFLARAGFTVNEVLESIDDTLLLAQAGALGLGQAADIASNVLQGFRLDADQASRAVDVLAYTASNANTTVGQLGEGMKFVAPVAAGVGVSLEETAGAMAALSDAGLQATLAGTGLRRVISELESPSKATLDLLTAMGLEQDDVRVSTVGLTAALENLKRAGIDTGIALEIFGDRGGPAFEVLASSIPKVKAMTAANLEAEGTAKRIAEVMDRNLKGAFLAARSAIEGLILKLGESGDTVGLLERVVRGVATAFRYMAENADTVKRVIAALLILLGTRGLIKAIRALTAVIMTNPIGLLLTALATGITLLITFSDKIRLSAESGATLADVFAETWEVIKELAAAIKDLLLPVLEALGVTVTDAFGETELSVKSVVIFVAKALDSVAGIFVGTYKAILVVWEKLPTNFEDIAKLSINAIVGIVEFLLDHILAVFQTIGDVMRNIGSLIKQVIANAAGAVGAAMKGNIEAAEAFKDNMTNSINLIGQAFTTLPDTFSKNLDRLQATEFLPKFELSKEAQELGQEIAEAFDRGFKETTGAEDLVRRILEAAERRAKKRAEEAAKTEAEKNAAFVQARLAEMNDLIIQGSAAVAGAMSGNFSLLGDFIEDAKLKAAGLLQTFQGIPFVGAFATVVGRATGLGPQPAEVDPEAKRLAEIMALRRKHKDLLIEIEGPQNALIKGQEDLTELLENDIITLDQYNAKLRELKIAALEADTSLGAGLERGLLRIQETIEDTGAVLENTLINAFHNAEDALVEFVKTGEFNMENFVDSLIEDLSRLAIRMLMMQALNLIIPGAGAVGGGLAGLFGGGLQHGGMVDRNRAFLVGEEGPELFVPPGQGDVVPADVTAGMLGGASETTIVQAAPPEVNLQIVNVQDSNEIPAAMDSPAGDRVVMNILRRNKSNANRILS